VSISDEVYVFCLPVDMRGQGGVAFQGAVQRAKHCIAFFFDYYFPRRVIVVCKNRNFRLYLQGTEN
jgi:hypothetical protein